jgi:hypothetical protein
LVGIEAKAQHTKAILLSASQSTQPQCRAEGKKPSSELNENEKHFLIFTFLETREQAPSDGTDKKSEKRIEN